MTALCRRVSDRRAVLGESPVYSPAEGCVWWIDIDGHLLLRTDLADGRTSAWRAPEAIGFVVLWPADRVVIGMGGSIFTFRPHEGEFARLTTPDRRAAIRFNDAAVDPAGCLWAATMDVENRRAIGRVYQIAPDLTARTVADGLITPNGIAIDPGRARLYLSDSHADIRMVWTLDIAAGAAGQREDFCDMRDLPGRPDGAAIDSAGNYWIAGVDGGEIYCFAPTGQLLRKVSVSVAKPTKLAFVPGARNQAWLTSKMDPDDGNGPNLSGHLLHCTFETAAAAVGEDR